MLLRDRHKKLAENRRKCLKKDRRSRIISNPSADCTPLWRSKIDHQRCDRDNRYRSCRFLGNCGRGHPEEEEPSGHSGAFSRFLLSFGGNHFALVFQPWALTSFWCFLQNCSPAWKLPLNNLSKHYRHYS